MPPTRQSHTAGWCHHNGYRGKRHQSRFWPVLQRRKVQHRGKQDHTREEGQDDEEEEEEEQEEEEHIECVCGVTGDTPGAQLYEGLWIQCEECLSWLHGPCVGFPKRAPKGHNSLPQSLVTPQSARVHSLLRCHTT